MKILLLIFSPLLLAPVSYWYGYQDEWSKITEVVICESGENCLFTDHGVYSVAFEKDKPVKYSSEYWKIANEKLYPTNLRDYCSKTKC